MALASARIPRPEAFSERKSSSMMTMGKRNFIQCSCHHPRGRAEKESGAPRHAETPLTGPHCAPLGGECANDKRWRPTEWAPALGVVATVRLALETAAGGSRF